MTKRQVENALGTLNFVDNINKLSVGRSTKFFRENSDGSHTLVAKVRCDTVGERPRKFSVTSSDMLPVGGGYTLKTIQSHILDDVAYVCA